ncbi:hypothetical protein BpsS36_00009 [Bacillus phage vB_BpsS-36]|uniref:DUF2190 family protein n=1 Tax=Bacillus phage vB_BpsS-36 TaxID=2419622 RepID=A0A3G3BWN8_9CAUD|nr:hypothetical protein BpsS36_00009 [Bacillus phage vB_BpsS-36]
MAQNKVEYHIQSGAFFTFKVKADETLKIGQLVELTGDRTVGVAQAGSEKAVGVVYGGTVGVDGIGEGFKGERGDVVTVVILKPFVYLTAGGNVTAGQHLKAGANGNAVAMAGEDTFTQKIGTAITGATSGGTIIAVLG